MCACVCAPARVCVCVCACVCVCVCFQESTLPDGWQRIRDPRTHEDLFVHHDTECVISWEALRVVGMTCFTAPPLPVLGPDGQVVFEPVSVLRVGVPIVLPPPPLPPMPVKREKDIVKKEMKQEKVAETCCDGEEKGEGVVKVEPVEVKKENVAGKTEVSGSVKEETRPYSPAQLAALAALGTWRWQHVTQPWASVAPA